MAPLSSCAPNTWIEPLRSRVYLIWEPIYKYFRFGGRHIEFLTSGYIERNPIHRHCVPEPRDHGLAVVISFLSVLEPV